jgi:hypothetical protein
MTTIIHTPSEIHRPDSSFRFLSSEWIWRCAALATAIAAISSAHATGHIDGNTLIEVSQGRFNGVQYTRYEAMFEGVTSNQRAYRVPCQIIAPANPAQGSGTLLFDWLVPSTIFTAVGQEQADARYTLTDDFLFGSRLSYATVRSDPAGIGRRSPVSDPSRPWSDGRLDTSSEFITSAGDEFDIVVDYVNALRSDPIALQVLGQIRRTAAFAYSASGYRLKGLLRLQMGVGLFGFSLVGGAGSGFDHPAGNGIGHSSSERAPVPGAGLEIDFQSETDGVVLEAYKTRHEEPNYRVYQFAGAAHIRDVDAAEFGLPDPSEANPANWVPFFRALFVAGNNWCDGIQPPPSIWLGAPNSPQIARDSRGNALVRYVGTQPVSTTGYRLPEVAVGENQYIPVAPSYDDGTFIGFFRVLAGGHVDLTSTFTDHNAYVAQITSHARALQAQGYLLEADADAIIREARQSGIGNP